MASSGSSASKKEENRRTLTDFKIVGLEVMGLAWSWGAVPQASATSEIKQEPEEDAHAHTVEQSISDVLEQKHEPESTASVNGRPGSSSGPASSAADPTTDSTSPKAASSSSAPLLPPPPSRIRIYFHTPVTADDSRPITSQGSFSLGSESSVRKGKRKKIDDDDGDLEDGRGAPPPPPQLSGVEPSGSNVSLDHSAADASAGRDSAAPSVAETASEGDWLMAAISEDDADGDGDTENKEDIDDSHDIDAEGEPDDYDGKPCCCSSFLHKKW